MWTSARIEEVPRWALMWGMALAIYASLKVLSWQTRRVHHPFHHPSLVRQVGYLLGWPGMNADRFLDATHEAGAVPSPREWSLAIGKFVLGCLLLLTLLETLPRWPALFAGWMGILAMGLILHFGLFHILSCVWRAADVDAEAIMNRPLLSRTVSEFWGRRWNAAFRDLTFKFLFQPFRRSLGPTGALFFSFLVSGLVHDLVISIPAGGGWGLPTLYFVIQGTWLLFERTRFWRSRKISRGWWGRFTTLAVVIGPCPLLFHSWFVRDVVVPFLEALRSLL